MLKIITNPTVAGLSAWLSLFTVILTALTKLNPEWFGTLTWPQALLLGIVAALAFAFLAALILLLYAYARQINKGSDIVGSNAEGGRNQQSNSASFESRLTSVQNHIADLLSKSDKYQQDITEANVQSQRAGDAITEIRTEFADTLSTHSALQSRMEVLGDLVCIQAAVTAAARYINIMERPSTALRWQQDNERVRQQVFAPHQRYCGSDESIGNGMVGNRAAPNEDLIDPADLHAFRQRYSDLGFAYNNLVNKGSIMRLSFEQTIAPT